jgi:hypothetical protein
MITCNTLTQSCTLCYVLTIHGNIIGLTEHSRTNPLFPLIAFHQIRSTAVKGCKYITVSVNIHAMNFDTSEEKACETVSAQYDAAMPIEA